MNYRSRLNHPGHSALWQEPLPRDVGRLDPDGEVAMTEKRIQDLPLKAKPDGNDELEIQETADGSSRKTTAAGLLGAGLTLVSRTVHLGNETGGIRIEAISPTRVQFVQGGTPILIIDSVMPWIASATPIGWRIQNQITWPSTPQYSNNGDLDSGLGFPAPNAVGISAGGVEAARFVTASAAVNYLKVKPSATSQPVDVEPDGADAAIPLRLRGKGGAKVRVGQVTAATDPSQFNPDAYVELHDEDGSTYFVPCMSTAW